MARPAGTRQMTMNFARFRSLAPCPVVIHSLDQALYQVTVVHSGSEHLLVENNGSPFRRRSIGEVLEILRLLPVSSASLRQRSAYDEMIGQPVREGDNVMEVPLRIDLIPEPTRH